MSRALAKLLRKNPTEAERALWRHLRMRQFKGFKFRRQQPLGQTIVDFVCLWNNQVLREIEAVTNAIWEALSCDRETPHLNPPPQETVSKLIFLASVGADLCVRPSERNDTEVVPYIKMGSFDTLSKGGGDIQSTTTHHEPNLKGEKT